MRDVFTLASGIERCTVNNNQSALTHKINVELPPPPLPLTHCCNSQTVEHSDHMFRVRIMFISEVCSSYTGLSV